MLALCRANTTDNILKIVSSILQDSKISIEKQQILQLCFVIEMIQLVFKYMKEKERREIEERRHYPLDMRLKENIVGQEEAILTVAASMMFYRTKLVLEGHILANLGIIFY